MPHVPLNGVELFYEDSGAIDCRSCFAMSSPATTGPGTRKCVPFGRAYRCITYSHRGFSPSSLLENPEAYSQASGLHLHLSRRPAECERLEDGALGRFEVIDP